MFAGYLKRPPLNTTDAQGWFDTGDLAFLDAEGFVRFTPQQERRPRENTNLRAHEMSCFQPDSSLDLVARESESITY